MENENNSALARAIPVPPGGGSWRFNEAKWEWVSNDPTPADEQSAATEPGAPNSTEQEQ